MANFRLDALTFDASALSTVPAVFEVDAPIRPERMKPVTEYQQPYVLKEVHGRNLYRVDLLWRDPEEGSFKNVTVQVFNPPEETIPSGTKVRPAGTMYISTRDDDGWVAFKLMVDHLEILDSSADAPAYSSLPLMSGDEDE